MRNIISSFNPLNIITALRSIGDARAERKAHELLAKEDDALAQRLRQLRLAKRQRAAKKAMGINAISHPGYFYNPRHSNNNSIYPHFRESYLAMVKDMGEATRGDNPVHCAHAARLAHM